MRILHSIAGASVGGAETFFLDAVKAIHELDYEQRVVTRFNSAHKVQEIQNLNIPLNKASYANYFPWPTSHAIKKAVNEFKPDIVHNWMGRAGTFAVEGSHANIGWYGGYYKPERFNKCQYHVAVTQDIADHIVRQGIDAANVFVLHVYAEFPKGVPLNRAEFDTPDDVPLLLSLARLHQKKGLDTLLDAMVKVPDAYLWIAGSGPIEQELKAQMKALKLDNRVRFLGWRNDREALLATADICVFPSRYEPFGAVVIEAWGTETPLVTAKAQGPKAYVTNEENGLIVEINDVDALAKSINRAITDDQLRAYIVANGKKAYDKDFTKEAFKKNVSALYSSIKR